MRLPASSQQRNTLLEVKMTPMIDVIFLLLIFFVCTASFRAAEQSLPTNLRLAGNVTEAEPLDPQLEDLEEVVIKLRGSGERVVWQVNERDYESLAELRKLLARLAGVDRGLPVVLDAEATLALGGVVDVYDLCRQVGFERIQFATRAGISAEP